MHRGYQETHHQSNMLIRNENNPAHMARHSHSNPPTLLSNFQANNEQVRSRSEQFIDESSVTVNRSVFVLQSSRVATLRYNAPASTERKCQQHDNEMTARKTRYTNMPWGTRDTIFYTRTKSVGTSQHQFKASVTNHNLNHLFINPFISHSTMSKRGLRYLFSSCIIREIPIYSE